MSLTFTMSGGPTQTVCVPFGLQASATDVDGVVTNLSIFLNGAPIASAPNSPLTTQAEIDYPALHTFTASASDDRGGTSWATQTVTLAAYPLHWIISGGFRTNGAFKLCMAGEPDRTYQILASDDLSGANWLPVGVMESTNGIRRFLDTDAANRPNRFYRAEQLP